MKANVIQRSAGSDSPATAGKSAISTARTAIARAPSASASSTELVASDRRACGCEAAKLPLASCRPKVERFAVRKVIAVRNATWPRPSAPSARNTIRTLKSDRNAAETWVPYVKAAERTKLGVLAAGTSEGGFRTIIEG